MPDRAPRIDVELFSDEAVAHPYPLYAQIRNAGAAVWLERYEMWAVSRYDDVRSALRADAILLSGKGVAMNEELNGTGNTNSLISDGEEHRRLRGAVMKPMMPKGLESVRGRMQALSDELVDRLLSMDGFDGISDFSRHLPLSVVSVLVGLPQHGRERMLEWAGAAFNALGPMNERARAAMPKLMEGAMYVAGLDRADLPPDGWAAGIYQAGDEGRIEPDEVTKLVFDYVSPSLDTTILATGHMLYQFGRNPEQFERLRKDRSRVTEAVHEALRIGSPVRAFTRLAAADYAAGDVFIPAGDRVAILYGSANHDERHYPDPEVFDIGRKAKDHVAFGYGVHHCAGAHLALLEMECLLDALARKVTTIEVGAPTPFPSNMLSGFASFPARFS